MEVQVKCLRKGEQPVKVTIIVSSWFKRYTDGLTSLEQNLNAGETAWEAVRRADIPSDEIGFITVCSKGQTGDGSRQTDGTKDPVGCGRGQPGTEKKVDESYVAADGDILKVYPMIIGG